MSKRLSHLWDEVTDFKNLLKAYDKASLGKRKQQEVALFSLNLENELLTLQQELRRQSYLPGNYRLFTIYERKPRLIAAAPFRDRIVHHALLNIVEPLIDKRFIEYSYACRKNKGVHKAVDRYQDWSRRYPYALKMDIHQYFPSIDHSLLKQKIAKHIKDPYILALFGLIIDNVPKTDNPVLYFAGDDLMTPFERKTGLPIGNLTSQFLANLYLDDFDHHLKEQLRVKPYLRYVDDFIILGYSKNQLQALRQIISERLQQDRLLLHPCKRHIIPVSQGLDVFGYRVFPGKRYLRNDNGHRFARRLRFFAKAYRKYCMDWQDINPSVQSWIGHAVHADTQGLRGKLFSSIVFSRGACQDAACVTRRFVEQQTVERAFG